jgi:hypothetical protein
MRWDTEVRQWALLSGLSYLYAFPTYKQMNPRAFKQMSPWAGPSAMSKPLSVVLHPMHRWPVVLTRRQALFVSSAALECVEGVQELRVCLQRIQAAEPTGMAQRGVQCSAHICMGCSTPSQGVHEGEGVDTFVQQALQSFTAAQVYRVPCVGVFSWL